MKYIRQMFAVFCILVLTVSFFSLSGCGHCVRKDREYHYSKNDDRMERNNDWMNQKEQL